MYGYYTDYGYMGFVDNKWILFVSEREYYEYLIELKEKEL